MIALNVLGLLDRKKTAFVLVDLQEAFRSETCDFEGVVANSTILVKASQILGIPLIVTEQYSKGLGKTIPEIELPNGIKPIAKTSFSCLGCAEFAQALKKTGAKSVVLFGIESHICILTTALDALKGGLEVHVAADAVSARTVINHGLGLERMRQSGVFIASTETVLFQLMKDAKIEEFKQVSELVK